MIDTIIFGDNRAALNAALCHQKLFNQSLKNELKNSLMIFENFMIIAIQ